MAPCHSTELAVCTVQIHNETRICSEEFTVTANKRSRWQVMKQGASGLTRLEPWPPFSDCNEFLFAGWILATGPKAAFFTNIFMNKKCIKRGDLKIASNSQKIVFFQKHWPRNHEGTQNTATGEQRRCHLYRFTTFCWNYFWSASPFLCWADTLWVYSQAGDGTGEPILTMA